MSHLTEERPSLENPPFVMLGGEAGVFALVEAFYEAMFQYEPALTQQHRRDPDGRVAKEVRDRFALFLLGWLGGPQTYSERHGHPRLRMRHGAVKVDVASRDAWLRSMQRALDVRGVKGGLRDFLDQRFSQVADFLRNQEEA